MTGDQASDTMDHEDRWRSIAERTGSERATIDLAARLARALQPGDVVTLDGPLGSGKTCFVRGLARGLNIDPAQVSSPTFVIRQEYAAADGATLIHIDGYRVTGPDDLESIGWEELLDSGESVVVVEWPSRLGAALRERVTLAVSFGHLSPTRRELTLAFPVRHEDRLKQVIANDEVTGRE